MMMLNKTTVVASIGCRARRKENQIKQKLFAWKRNTKIPEGTKRQKEDFVGRPQGSGSLGKATMAHSWHRAVGGERCTALPHYHRFLSFLHSLMERREMARRGGCRH